LALEEEILKKLDDLAKDSTVAAFIKSQGSSSRGAPLTKEEQEKAQKDVAKRFGDLGASSYKLVKDISSNRARLSSVLGNMSDVMQSVAPDFAQDMLKITEGIGKEGLAIAEAGVDTFRSLSDTGASFGNSILDMTKTASDARLSLDQFAGMVSQNSDALAGMGGSVTRGAKIFADQSKKMFEGPFGQELLNMGYSFEEVNEMLMSNLVTNRRVYAQDKAARATALESTVLLAKEMDSVAKLTGIERKELQAAIDEKMRQGNVDAQLRLQEIQGNAEVNKKFQAAFAASRQMGDQGILILEELFTKGAIKSEEGIAAVNAIGPELYAQLQEMVKNIKDPNKGLGALEGVSEEVRVGLNKRMKDPSFLKGAALGDVNKYTQSMATLVQATSRTVDAVDAVGDANDSAAEKARKQGELAESEQAQRGDAITRSVIAGETAIKGLGNSITTNLLGQDGAITRFSYGLNGVAESMEKFAQNSGDVKLSDFDAKLKSALNTAQTAVGGGPRNAPPITEVPRDIKTVPATQGQIGELAKSITAIKNAVDSSGNKETGQVMAQGFTDSVKVEFLELIRKAVPGGDSVDQKVAQLIESGNTELVTNLYKQAQREGEPTRTEGDINKFVKMAFATPISQAISQAQVNLNKSTEAVPKMNNGTLGAFGSLIKDFGSGTLAELHNDEAVITTAQLENMAKGMSATIQNVKPQSQSTDMSGFTQAVNQLTAKIDTLGNTKSGPQDGTKELTDMLNSTMKELSSNSRKQFDVAMKQLKVQKGFGGNVFRGV